MVANVGEWHYRVGLTLAHEALHQSGAHIASTIGNGIIHCKSADGRNKCGITVSHARELHAVPVLVAHTIYHRHCFARDAYVEGVEESHLAQAVMEHSRLALIAAQDNLCHTDI